MVSIQNRAERLLDTVLNPQGQPISKERRESTFIKTPPDRKWEMDAGLPDSFVGQT